MFHRNQLPVQKERRNRDVIYSGKMVEGRARCASSHDVLVDYFVCACIEIVIIYISSMKLFLIDVFQK